VSTIAEHLVALELYEQQKAWDCLLIERDIFLRTHLAELIAMCDPAEILAARAALAERINRARPTPEAKS
jgi:hypothetical protein